jgi:hypothetical protein
MRQEQLAPLLNRNSVNPDNEWFIPSAQTTRRQPDSPNSEVAFGSPLAMTFAGIRK